MAATTKRAPVTVPERISVSHLQPEAYRQARALTSAIATGDLERSLIDLIEVRVSKLNGCAFCIELHVLNAEEASVFTARERAALAPADAVTPIRGGHVPDAVWAAVTEEFSERERAALILNASMINFWNRVAITSRTTPGGAL